MLDSVAKIFSSVILGLGTPESLLLQECAMANIVYRKIAYYDEGMRQTDQNVLAKKTSEFTLAAGVNSQDMTSLTASDIVIPLWCERQIYSGANVSWEFVPTVNMDTLAEYRSRRLPGVAFYGDTPSQITAEFSYFGDETQSPYNTFRVWYSPISAESANREAAITMPATLTHLIVVDAQLAILPLLVVNAAKYLDKQPQMAPRISAWQGMMPSLMQEKSEWTARFETWNRKSRSFHRARNHTEVLDVY